MSHLCTLDYAGTRRKTEDAKTEVKIWKWKSRNESERQGFPERIGTAAQERKNLVHQGVMIDKSNQREDKEARTGRAGTKKLDIKGDTFVNQWGVVGKSIGREESTQNWKSLHWLE